MKGELEMKEQERKSGTEIQEGFSVGLALLDAVPVLFFALSGIIIGTACGNPIVIVGAVLMVVGGMSKVLWKLLQGLGVGNYPILNKIFVPCMGSGFLSMAVGIVISFIKKSLTPKGVLKALVSFPAVLFFGIAVIAMGLMGKVKSEQSREEFNKDSKKNWLAEVVNSVAQISLFAGLVFAKKFASKSSSAMVDPTSEE